MVSPMSEIYEYIYFFFDLVSMICWTGIAVLAIGLCLRSVFCVRLCVFACVWCEVTHPKFFQVHKHTKIQLQERETLEHFILHCPRGEEWRIERRSLHRPRVEETDQVLGEGHESNTNTKKRTLPTKDVERQRLIRNNQENAETWSNQLKKDSDKKNISETVIRKKY